MSQNVMNPATKKEKQRVRPDYHAPFGRSEQPPDRSETSERDGI